MRMKYHCLALMMALAVLLTANCKPRNNGARPSAPAPGPSPAEIAAARDALARGMEPIALTSLTAAYVGRQCVVTTQTTKEAVGSDSAPPPLGMVHKLGTTTIYKGEIQEVSVDRLTIRAAYPTSGRYKIVEIPRVDIQSLHVAKSSSQ